MGNSVKVFFAGVFSDSDRVPATFRGRKLFYNPDAERYDVAGFEKQVYCSIEQFNDYEKQGLIIPPEDQRKQERDSRFVNGELDLSYRIHTKDGYRFKKEKHTLDENDSEYFIPDDFKSYEQEAAEQDWQRKMTKSFKEALKNDEDEVDILEVNVAHDDKWEHIYDSVADIRNAFTGNDYY